MKKAAQPRSVRHERGQQIQDEIFRKMSAERKIRLVSSFWDFAKQVAGDRIYYQTNGIRKLI